MNEWEYVAKWCGDHDLMLTLETHGKEGWECFSVHHKPPGEFSSALTVRLFFKRPKEQPNKHTDIGKAISTRDTDHPPHTAI
jgi:hypothetical protein